MISTPLEALYATRNYWQWVIITGETNYPPALKWPAGSACCKYVLSSLHQSCLNDCPLAAYAWPRGCALDNNSLYSAWLHKRDSANAQCIVNACNRAIEDIICR